MDIPRCLLKFIFAEREAKENGCLFKYLRTDPEKKVQLANQGNGHSAKEKKQQKTTKPELFVVWAKGFILDLI